MSLTQLLGEGKLRNHTTSQDEIRSLIQLVMRDIHDAKISGLSSDRKFTIAYNAVVQTSMMLLYCNGYRTKARGQHFVVFEALKEIMGETYYELIDYFDSCRAKRNITEYACSDEISEAEASELIREAEEFLGLAVKWGKNRYPKLINGSGMVKRPAQLRARKQGN